MGVNQDQGPAAVAAAGGRSPAIRRAALVLELVAHRRRLRPTEVSRELGLAKSSTADLVGTMLGEGLLDRRGDDLVLGRLFREAATGFVGDGTILRRFGVTWERSPLLREHTVTLQAPIGAQSVCVAVRLGRRVLPYTPRSGSRQPLWSQGEAEPVAVRSPAKALLRSLDLFEPGDGAAGLRAWLERRADAASDPVRLPSSTGNDELVAVVPAVRPVLAVVHLHPDDEVDEPALAEALTAFAESLPAAP